jgi:hypothetical protein
MCREFDKAHDLFRLLYIGFTNVRFIKVMMNSNSGQRHHIPTTLVAKKLIWLQRQMRKKREKAMKVGEKNLYNFEA